MTDPVPAAGPSRLNKSPPAGGRPAASDRAPIAVLGAIDRMNYGDLLFPIVLEEAFRRLGLEPGIRAYGLRASDLSAYGALPTASYRQLLRDVAGGHVSALVLAGGEMLGARWSTMLMYLGSPVMARAVKGSRRLIGQASVERMVRAVLRTPTDWPWVLAPSDLPRRIPVAYNAVGGITTLQRIDGRELAALAEKLSAADYLAVRDASTAGVLRQAGAQNVRVAPDSAVLIADLFPIADVAERCRQVVRDLAGASGPYLCLQVNRSVGGRHVAELAAQVAEIEATLGLRTLLLPIGRAAGHEDQVPLARIAAETSAQIVRPPDDLTIFEILYLIASARAFAGTSLHGAITSLAYDVPHLALSSEIPKLLAHLETWDLEEFRGGVEPTALVAGVRRVLAVPRERIVRRREVAVGKAWDHVRCLAEAIAS